VDQISDEDSMSFEYEGGEKDQIPKSKGPAVHYTKIAQGKRK